MRDFLENKKNNLILGVINFIESITPILFYAVVWYIIYLLV